MGAVVMMIENGVNKTLALVFLFSSVCSVSSFAGDLVRDDMGFRYINDDGSFKTGWHQEGENGPWYYFGDDGWGQTGWIQYEKKRYYLSPKDGQMFADRYTTMGDSLVYRFDSDGVCSAILHRYSGWLLDDTGWYYRDPDQSYVTGWREFDEEWYYFDEVGYMKTGLAEIDGVNYYFEGNGIMVHDDSREIDGIAYNMDSSGAAVVAWPYKAVTYVVPEDQKSDFHKSVDAMADSVLARIVNSGMSRRQKAEAVYAWIRGSFRYSGHSATRDWVEEAYQGLRRRHGDCYTYFAVSQELLVRCGIPCMEVVRYTDNDHYWNLVQLDDGQWYHFDATPRSAGGYFCLWTDGQMLSYSVAHSNCFAFDRALYPPTP